MHTLTARLTLPATATAFLAASVIAVAPPPSALTALPAVTAHPAAIPTVQVPDIQLAATVADIFQFPAFRQWVVNQVDDVLTIGVGLAKAGQGVQQTIAAIPGLVVTVTQQVLARDLVGALGTVEAGLIGAATVIGGPILVSVIERNQRQIAVDLALQQAVPAALIGLGTGLVGGFNDVAVSAIVAGQNVVAALLPLNIGNLVTAVVDGAKLVAHGLTTGAGKVVNGIVFAQQTIANALATTPPPLAATTPAPASGVAATAIPKIVATKVKPATKPAPTSAKPAATTPAADDPTDTTKDTKASDTGGKTEKKTTEKKPKPKAGNKTRGHKAPSTSQAAA